MRGTTKTGIISPYGHFNCIHHGLCDFFMTGHHLHGHLVYCQVHWGLAIRWLISSAELLEGVTDLKDEYNKNKTTQDDEQTVNLLVKMTSHYRQNKPTIKTMMTLSRIAGACFLVSGAYILVTAAIGFGGFSTWELFLQVLGAGFNFAMAGASFAIPHFFGNYSKVWDYRIEQTMKAENQLQQQLGDFEE